VTDVLTAHVRSSCSTLTGSHMQNAVGHRHSTKEESSMSKEAVDYSCEASRPRGLTISPARLHHHLMMTGQLPWQLPPHLAQPSLQVLSGSVMLCVCCDYAMEQNLQELTKVANDVCLLGSRKLAFVRWLFKDSRLGCMRVHIVQFHCVPAYAPAQH
jgi:hypothetical protein